ncbi:MAG TPA: MaoC/PaaZ C-terminal domain-containing protein [Candidatus Binataceae bacterium]|nr:MaoC/PaaZ C-terminal domain-containing protein [Candidatus Binataceae bacterium]
MPLDSSLVGTKVGPIEAEVDARWTMAYAAGLEDMAPCYLDTRRGEGIVAHPMFPVCFEWPAAGAIRARLRASMAPGEPARGVHATHHTILHRAIRPPLRVQTTAEVIGVERRSAGAYETVRFETLDERRVPIATTYYGSLYRQVDIAGPERPATVATPGLKAEPPANPLREQALRVAAGAAHIYTECARIWNPIHTDTAVAAAAGLPGLILHGTATLALAVSAIVHHEAAGDPTRVREIYARFAAMVLMPSEIRLRIMRQERGDGDEKIHFEVLSAEGGRAIRDGLVVLNR